VTDLLALDIATLFARIVLAVGVLWCVFVVIVGIGLMQPGRSMQDVWRERARK
jgi:hypothetical protein